MASLSTNSAALVGSPSSSPTAGASPLPSLGDTNASGDWLLAAPACGDGRGRLPSAGCSLRCNPIEGHRPGLSKGVPPATHPLPVQPLWVVLWGVLARGRPWAWAGNNKLLLDCISDCNRGLGRTGR